MNPGDARPARRRGVGDDEERHDQQVPQDVLERRGTALCPAQAEDSPDEEGDEQKAAERVIDEVVAAAVRPRDLGEPGEGQQQAGGLREAQHGPSGEDELEEGDKDEQDQARGEAGEGDQDEDHGRGRAEGEDRVDPGQHAE